MIGTCTWLFENPTYQRWCSQEINERRECLLLIKGSVGSGKSTLIKEATKRVAEFGSYRKVRVADFYFTTGSTIESTMLGLLRSLIVQLISNFPKQLQSLIKIHQEKRRRGPSENSIEWYTEELEEALEAMFTENHSGTTFIFIDALDKCKESAEDLVNFLHRVVAIAHRSGASLRVCVSSDDSFPISPFWPQISVHSLNKKDVEHYVNEELVPSETGSRWHSLRKRVADRSYGRFIWAGHLINILNTSSNDGLKIGDLENRLEAEPDEMEALYFRALESIDEAQKLISFRMFQWAILSARPLSLEEWHDVLALIEDPHLESLHQVHLRECPMNTDNHDECKASQVTAICRQVIKRIMKLSGCLIVEVERDDNLFCEVDSLRAEAASIEATKSIQVYHESVREFFFRKGFAMLYPGLKDPIGDGHVFIMQICARYAFLEELNVFRDETIDYGGRRINRRRGDFGIIQRVSMDRMSVGSSASNSGLRDSTFKDTFKTLERHDTEEYRIYRKESIPKQSEFSEHFGLNARLPAEGPGVGSEIQSENSNLNSGVARLDYHKANPEIFGKNKLPDTEANTHVVNQTYREVLERDDDYSSMPLGHWDGNLTKNNNMDVPSIRIGSTTSTDLYRQLDFLPLFCYVSNEFIFHATAAEKDGADPAPVLWVIHSLGWRSWAKTRPDMLENATMMYFAALYNLPSWARWLISANQDPNVEGGELRWPIIIAANRGNREILSMLLHHGANLEAYDENGRTAMHHALATNDVSMLQVFQSYYEFYENFLDKFCYYYESSEEFYEKLHEKFYRRFHKKFYKKRYDISHHQFYGKTKVLRARRTSWTAKETLKQAVNTMDYQGQTPLHVAALQCSSSVIQKLLDFGAKFYIRDENGNSPLHLVYRRPKLDIKVCQTLFNSAARKYGLEEAARRTAAIVMGRE